MKYSKQALISSSLCSWKKQSYLETGKTGYFTLTSYHLPVKNTTCFLFQNKTEEKKTGEALYKDA